MFKGAKELLTGADPHNDVADFLSLERESRQERLDYLVPLINFSGEIANYMHDFNKYDFDPELKNQETPEELFSSLSDIAVAFFRAGPGEQAGEPFLNNPLSWSFLRDLPASGMPAKAAYWHRLADSELRQHADEFGLHWQKVAPGVDDYLWSSLHWLDQHEPLPDIRQQICVAHFLGEMVQFRLRRGGNDFDDPLVGPWKRIAIKYAQSQKADPKLAGAVFCNRLRLAIADSVGEAGGSTELVLRLQMLVATLYFDALLSNPVGRELLYTFKLRDDFAPWVELFIRSWSGLSQARQRYLLADSWPDGSFNTREQFITIGVAAGLLGHKPGRTCVAAYLDGSLPKEP